MQKTYIYSNKILMSEWDFNKNIDLDPKQITTRSGRKVSWICSNDNSHTWDARIADRTGSANKKGQGCPFCSGNRPSKQNNLSNNKKLIKEWSDKNHPKLPTDYTAKSGLKVWWECPKNKKHTYQASIISRTRGRNCPYCASKKLHPDESLEKLFPDIAKEWHPTKNKKLLPSSCFPSSNKKVWWQCNHHKEHSWSTTPLSRTYAKTGCPKCTSQTSSSEIRIFTELKSIFDEVKIREKIKGKEGDVAIKELKLVIEFDGAYFHKNRTVKDLKKDKHFQKYGYSCLRIREKGLRAISKDCICLKGRKLDKNDINSILKWILKNKKNLDLKRINSYLKKKEFQNEKDYQRYISYLPNPFPEHSLEKKFPKIAKDWDYERNYPLTPKNFSYGSQHLVHWVCSTNSSHRWQTKISDRTSPSGHSIICPFCSKKRPSEEFNFATEFPNIAKEWHPTKNKDLKPQDFLPGSGVKIWWKCDKGEDHEWKTKISMRTVNNSGCPVCLGRKVTKLNNLAYKFPNIAKEWHPTKNKDLKPKDFLPGSNIKVWWQCKKDNGHEWEQDILTRTTWEAGCPFCGGRKLTQDNNLAYKFPNIAKEWHPTKNKDLKPQDFLSGSNKMIWWKCDKGEDHEWKTRISQRTINKTGCPFCWQLRRKKNV